MDHLPIPDDVVSNPKAIVPYVCLKDYDGGLFLTYPTREGVAHALPPDGNIPGGSPYRQHERTYPTPKQEQEDFLQRWLCFGLVNEILDHRWRPDILIRPTQDNDGETKVVSTLGLVETLDSWIADIQTGNLKPRNTYEHVAECLRLTFATIHGAGPDFDPRVKISLASLGELFSLAANEAYRAQNNKCPNTFSPLLDLDHWKSTVLSSGWCPSQVEIMFDSSEFIQTLHFLTFLGQPNSDDCHWRCNSDRCLADQSNLTTYQTKHVTGCKCEQLSIDTKRLNEILEDGYLPLLRIQQGHTLNELSVELVSSHATSRYIALSHVWADGLGNPHENALPRCQLDFLRRTIKENYEDVLPEKFEGVLLWCDTLCCPVQPGKAKDIALAQMKQTYLKAARVLVLDASLAIQNIETMDLYEAGIRIFNSRWTRRLWTLQEGALAATDSRLSFWFKDRAISLSYLTQKISQLSTTNIGRKGVAIYILTRIANFSPVSYEVDGKQHRDLGSIEAGLRNRSVSVPSDEPLLIANLLDLDVVDILNGPCPLANCAGFGCDHSRIHRLWLLMPTIFQGIPKTILHRLGPRLSEPGFRWAPSTLLYQEPQNHWLQSRAPSKKTDTTTTNSIFTSRPSNSVSFMPLNSFPTLLSAFWKPVAVCLFHIRMSLQAGGWASAVLRSLRPTSLVTENMDRGIPTSRGLLVRFTGYSFSMARCPAGIPNDPWNLRRQEGQIYLRGVDATWYMIDRRLPAERDPFLSTRSLREIIEEEGGNLWVTHVESAFSNPQLVAKAKGGQQVADALLASLVSDENGIKYVQSKLHVKFAVAQFDVQKLLETAYQSAKQLLQDLAKIPRAVKPADDEDDIIDVNSPQNKPVRERLEQEIQRVAMRNASPDVAAATAEFSQHGMMLFQTLIAMMLVGGYGRLGTKTADSQQWCFD